MVKAFLVFITTLALFPLEGQAKDKILTLDVQTDEPALNKELHPWFREPPLGNLLETVDALKAQVKMLETRVLKLEKRDSRP